jgi:hypothetical protein
MGGWDVRDVVAVEHTSCAGRVGFLSYQEIVDSLNIVDHCHDATCEHEQTSDDRENANDVKTNEDI